MMRFKTIKDDRLSLLVLFAMMISLTCIPASINIKYSVIVGNIQFRFNIWFSFICALVLIIFRNRRTLNAFEQRFYLFVVVSFAVALLMLGANIEYRFISIVEAVLVVTLPFFGVQRVLHMSIENQKRFYNLSLIIGLLISVQTVFYSIFYKIMGWQGVAEYARDNTTLGSSTTSGGFCFSIFVLAYVAYKRWNKKRYLVVSLIMVLSILVMRGRSAIIMIALFCFIEFISSNVKNKLKIIICFAAVISIAYCLFPDLFAEIWIRFFTNQSIDSNTRRLDYALAGIAHFEKYPIFGGGLGLVIRRISWISPFYSNSITNTHNQWIALLAETGLVGTILFFRVITWVLRTAKKEKAMKVAVMAFAEFVVVAFMFEVYITADIRSGMALWLLLLPIKMFKTSYE